MIDKKIIVPECKRILELMNVLNRKSPKREVKIIANIILNSTRNWLYGDTVLRSGIDYLCLSPNGEREHMLDVVDYIRERLEVLINDPFQFGELPWKNEAFDSPYYTKNKSHLIDSLGSMDDKLSGILNRNKENNEPVSKVFIKSDDAKTREALKATYSQNLKDWE